MFLGLQGLPEESEIAPNSAREGYWAFLGTKDRSGGPKLKYVRPKLRYLGRFGALCRQKLAEIKSGEVKIPSKVSIHG